MKHVQLMGWAKFVQGVAFRQASLIQWKLDRFKKEGWGGSSVEKWGGTGSVDVPLNDEQVPFGCVSFVDGAYGGVAFVINNDLRNYPVDGDISAVFDDSVPVEGEVANPWFAGELVDESLRGKPRLPGESDSERLGLGRKQEQWIINQARQLADAGKWPYPRRRLWLFTEREPLPFLPEMYARWGWKLHRTFEYDGLQRWVMYMDF